MGRQCLELRMLRKIPAKYYKTEIFDGDPPGLERAYGAAADRKDPYHIRARIRSRYCSMDELKKYLLEHYENLDLSSWSMSGGYGHRDVRVSTGDGQSITVPYELYETLQTDHIDEAVFECQELCWSLDLAGSYSDASWLEPILPCYIDRNVILETARMRIEYARRSDPEDRNERIGMAGWSGSMAPDVIGFLADGLAEAKSKRHALYACLVD